MSLSRTWELGGTIFNSKNALVELLTAASADDVQPQAVRAAEALGGLMVVAPIRVGEGVDALCGNDSVPLQNLKVWVGLNSGGIVKIMRESTALVKFFLLCTACQLCYTTDEIGDMMFEMLSGMGLIEKTAVSSTQLARLVSKLSGHANKLLPFDRWAEMATRVDDVACDLADYSHLGYREIAQLLFRVFEALRDDETTSIHISIRRQCVWLATLLSWLLEDQVLITSGSAVLCGSTSGKVVLDISLDVAFLSTLNLRVFRHEQSVKEYLSPCPARLQSNLSRAPRLSTKGLIWQQYLNSLPAVPFFADRQMADRWTECLGMLALGLGNLLLSKGTIGNGAPLYLESSALAPLTAFPQAVFPPAHLEQYGWRHFTETQLHETASLLQNLKQVYDLAVDKSTLVHDLNRHRSDSPFMAACIAFVREHEVCEPEFPALTHVFLVKAAFPLAVDMVCTSLALVDANECAPQLYVAVEWLLSFEKASDCFNLILDQGMLRLYALLELSVQLLVPGVPQFTKHDLVVQRDGIVAGVAAVWDISATMRHSCRIRLMSGDIRKDGRGYRKITEFITPPRLTAPSFPASLIPDPMSLNLDILYKHSYNVEFVMRCSIAVAGSVLEVQYCLVRPLSDASIATRQFGPGYSNANVLQTILFRNALQALAIATHCKGDYNGIDAASISDFGKQLYWVPPLHHAQFPDMIDIDQHRQSILSDRYILLKPTLGDPALVLAAISALHEAEHESFLDLMIHESGPIASTVAYAALQEPGICIVMLGRG